MAARSLRDRILLVLLLLGFSAACYKTLQHTPASPFQAPVQPNENKAANFHTGFVSTQQDIATHAASLVELGDGRIRAFWFAGSREGAEDVTIRTSVFDPATGTWDKERSIVDHVTTQHDLLRYVKKIGNPVPYRANDGTLWLFYVTVSLGGWAGSSITAITSKDDGASWSPARRLITSPFINISTLVKGIPFEYADGTLGLPVYHEFIGKFAELLRLSPDGTVLDKQRLTDGKQAIQPVVLVRDAQHATVLMRDAGPQPRHVITTETADGGQHWSKAHKSDLPNPDAAVTGAMMPDGRLLAVINDNEANREELSLAVSNDNGNIWKIIYRLEDQRGQQLDPAHYAERATQLAQQMGVADASAYGASAQRAKCEGQNCDFEFSYPYLIRARNGDYYLVYTWNRSFIKHARFTQAWVDQKIIEQQMKVTNDATSH